MPDKKVATQASDGPWERETIITFNDAEKKASYYTCNKARVNNPALTSPLVIDGACRATRKPD